MYIHASLPCFFLTNFAGCKAKCKTSNLPVLRSTISVRGTLESHAKMSRNSFPVICRCQVPV